MKIIGCNVAKPRWGRCVLAGILLVALGAAAVTTSITATRFVMLVIGALLIAAGLSTLVHGFSQRGWSSLFLDILTGAVYLVGGALMLTCPAASAATLTLVIAMCLVFLAVFCVASWLSYYGYRTGVGCFSRERSTCFSAR
jgi:uncharacterized membrane protein HdeD (DUF308 family)